jgi:glutathione peroxidase
MTSTPAPDFDKAPGSRQGGALFSTPVTTIEGEPTTLEPYRGRVLLIVNVASRCGYTPQYAGLEALYRRYRDHGLTVLGFPCDQFGNQEPGTEAEIVQFCSTAYDVTFPMFAKIDVNGPHEHPLYRQLKSQAPGARHHGGEVELHEVPREPERRNRRAILAARHAGRHRGGRRVRRSVRLTGVIPPGQSHSNRWRRSTRRIDGPGVAQRLAESGSGARHA